MHLEAAHVLGREHDKHFPVRDEEGWNPHTVAPDRIIPLCGPVGDTRTCHGLDHQGKLDKLRLLTLDEQVQAVMDAGGIEQARVRLIPFRETGNGVVRGTRAAA